MPWIARHGLTSAEYQQLFDQLVRRGYRLRCVSGYEERGEARFACIWDRYAGPAWEARHNVIARVYQSEFDALSSRGFRLIQVAGYTIQGMPHFAAVWNNRLVMAGRPGTASSIKTISTSSIRRSAAAFAGGRQRLQCRLFGRIHRDLGRRVGRSIVRRCCDRADDPVYENGRFPGCPWPW